MPLYLQKGLSFLLRWKWGVLLAGVIALAGWNCFFLLGSESIRDWDEARHGISAFEMLHGGSLFINTFQYTPDYWNSKPILSFFPMQLGYALFGFTPFGLRFFSAVATVGTVLSMLFFCRARFTPGTALLSIAMLLTSQSFMGKHNARAGDADALYILLYTAALFAVLWKEKNIRAYYVAALLASCAFLTKSFHAGPLGCTLILFFVMDFGITRRSLLHAIGCAFCAAAPIVVWVIFRYQYDGSVFFEHMLANDLFDRVSQGIEGHAHGPSFYFIRVWRAFNAWLVVTALCLLFLGWYQKRKEAFFRIFLNKTVGKLFLAVLVPFCMYSLSASKLRWYLFPAYPFIAILLAHATVVCSSYFSLWGKRLAVVCLGIIFVVAEVEFTRMIYKRGTHGEYAQTVMKELGRTPAYRGAVLYLEGTDWSQRHILASYLYGPFTLMPGNAPGYAASPMGQCSFLIKKDSFEKKCQDAAP